MQIEQVAGDFTYRVEKSEGKYNFSRRFNNAPGAQFEEVECLDDVPPEIIKAAKTYSGMTGST
jgi:hypothetical protein